MLTVTVFVHKTTSWCCKMTHVFYSYPSQRRLISDNRSTTQRVLGYPNNKLPGHSSLSMCYSKTFMSFICGGLVAEWSGRIELNWIDVTVINDILNTLFNIVPVYSLLWDSWNCRSRQRRTGNWRTKSLGWTLQNWRSTENDGRKLKDGWEIKW